MDWSGLGTLLLGTAGGYSGHCNIDDEGMGVLAKQRWPSLSSLAIGRL